MSRKNTRDPFVIQHMTIANAIRHAKRKMFQCHRQGLDLVAASDLFVSDVLQVVREQASQPGGDEIATDVPAFVTELKADLEREGYRGPTRAQNDLAAAVAEIITNDAAPPRLRDGVVDYVADAPPIEPPAIGLDEEQDRRDHDRRYSKDSPERLTDAQIKDLAENIVNCDNKAARNMVVLMDQFERASFDRFDIDNIAITVRDTIARYIVGYSDFVDRVIEEQRETIKGTA